MILIDSNVIMYAAGAEHENKGASVELLERVARDEVDAALDAEVLQEILHRYRAIRRWRDGRRVFDLARRVFPVVLPITVTVLDEARGLLDQHEDISARDALHAAVVLQHGLDGIASFDQDFDRIDGVTRFVPGH